MSWKPEFLLPGGIFKEFLKILEVWVPAEVWGLL